MNALKAKNKQGFTIIEVVLVLAIAALIFLMVFIALPALQRNQRDTARKTILGKVTSGVTNYQSNNRGKNPTATAVAGSGGYAKFEGYIDGKTTANGIEMEDEYLVTIAAYTAQVSAKKFDDLTSDRQVIQIVTGAKCSDDGTSAVKGNNRNAAALIGLENGEASLCQSV